MITLSLIFVSFGKNNYGHPSDIAIDSLNKRDIAYLMTGRNGSIRITFSNHLDIHTCQ